MEEFNPLYIKNRIEYYLNELTNINPIYNISDNIRQDLNKLKKQVNFLLDQNFKSYDCSDDDEESPGEENKRIHSMTYSFIHLVIYLSELIYLYNELTSISKSETDKRTSLIRCICNIQCPEEIMTKSIKTIFNGNYYKQDEKIYIFHNTTYDS